MKILIATDWSEFSRQAIEKIWGFRNRRFPGERS